MGGRTRLDPRAILAAAGVALLMAGPAAAQALRRAAPSFLVINQEQILTGSQRGSALLAEEDAAREKLRSEARAIDAAFEAEEEQLTALRATLSPAEFRPRAEDFDKRVVAARREQDTKSAALVQEFDGRRRQFYALVAPVLVRLMEEKGAVAIFDESSVLLADQGVVVTADVIAEIDAAFQADPAAPAPDASGQTPAPAPAPAPVAPAPTTPAIVPPPPPPALAPDRGSVVPPAPRDPAASVTVSRPEPAPGLERGVIIPAPRPRPGHAPSQTDGE